MASKDAPISIFDKLTIFGISGKSYGQNYSYFEASGMKPSVQT